MSLENTNSYTLEVKNLTVDFKTKTGIFRAVDQLSFKIPRGKTVGLVGESGSGKSVTSLAVMGLLPGSGSVSAGSILFNGVDLLKIEVAELRKLRGAKIAMIFQEPMTSLNPVMTIGEQIEEAILLHQPLSRAQARAKTIELMTKVMIPAPLTKIDCYPHELSGGQKQRVMIAMSMSCDPELLICDEPTTALDVTIQKEILELLLKLQKTAQMSILFITHDLGVIAQVADELVVMYRSHMVESGLALEIFKQAKHPYTKGLLACRPRLDHNPQRLLTVSDFMTEDGTELNVAAEKLVQTQRQADRSQNLATQDVLLEVRNLKVYYPIKSGFLNLVTDYFRAVDDVSFTIRKGMTFGLVGESGCGKTTLGRTILRLMDPTAGEIFFKNQKISHISKKDFRPLRKNIQMIFQDPYSSLDPRMSIREILLEPFLINEPHLKKVEMLDRISRLIKKVGLKKNCLNRYPHEFSGGQRQRICIARALTLNPELIVCDEAVSALDVSVQAQVLNLLLDLQEEFKLSYLFISHDLSVVNFMADTIAVMHAGKIVEQGSPAAIYSHPQHLYTQKLISAIPALLI